MEVGNRNSKVGRRERRAGGEMRVFARRWRFPAYEQGTRGAVFRGDISWIRGTSQRRPRADAR